MTKSSVNPFREFHTCSLLLVGLLFYGPVVAQDYESGRSAYINGNYGQALEILKPLAEGGDPEAQKILAIMYDYGHGLEKDQQEALYWYIRSAEQGQPAVQYQVGAKYFRGEGTEQDYDEAAKWWEMAANAGQVDAQFNLGLMYYRGLSVETDNARAAELFTQAAEQGHSYAQYSLAVMYSFGQGVEKKYETALEWFRKSSEQGVAQAQFNMGVYYENGYGVEPDMQEARRWYERASAQGLSEATEKLAALDRGFPEPEPEPVPEPGITPETVASAPVTPNEPVSNTQTQPAALIPETGGIRRETWVLAQPAEYYTLQIGSVTSERDIVEFLQENGIEGEAAYIEVEINGVTRYNAVYGVYSDFSEANAAIDSLPRGLRSVQPWVRNFGILHRMLN